MGLAFGLFAFERLLAAHVDLDLLRLGFSALGQIDGQHAVVVLRVDVLGVHGVRQRERAGETAVAALNATEVLFLLFLLELALAADGKRVVLDLHVEVFLIDAGHLQLQLDTVLVLVNVHRRHKRASGQRVFASYSVLLLGQTAHAVLQRVKFTKRVPTGQYCHGSSSSNWKSWSLMTFTDVRCYD